MDFTLKSYNLLLHSLQQHGFSFQGFGKFLEMPGQNVVILRHDVDLQPRKSLIIAQLEGGMGITGTYYFRAVPQSFDEEIIRQIADLGQEIGYHYESLSTCRGNFECAIKDFEKNLERFRNIIPVKTICMHGAPLSKYDNRVLWRHYNYKDYGIIGEPYFDIDFNQILYLTDTGRRWNGENYSVRDKVKGQPQVEEKLLNAKYNFRSTFDIIRAAERGELPDKIMFNIHPQRWNDKCIPWLSEYISQNIKNVVKKYLLGN